MTLAGMVLVGRIAGTGMVGVLEVTETETVTVTATAMVLGGRAGAGVLPGMIEGRFLSLL